MKYLSVIGSVILLLVLSACGSNFTPEAGAEKNDGAMSQAQALKAVQEVPNFQAASEALKASDDSLLLGKATLTPDSEGSAYSTLVIQSEKGQSVIEATFDQQRLESLTLLSLPDNTAVDLLKGTVQKFNSQRTSLVEEGLWKGTESLKELTSVAENAEGTALEPLVTCAACTSLDIAAGRAQAAVNLARLTFWACAVSGDSSINCINEAFALDDAREANRAAQQALDDCEAINC